MTLQKMVDGITVDMSPEEEAAVQAEWDVNAAIAPDWNDQSVLNAALAQPGSVVRALALLTLQEINNLRTKAGLATYTQAQFVTALKAKMR